MPDRQAELEKRTSAIAQQQELVRLLLPPQGIISKDQIAESLSEEDIMREQTMQRLRGILEPYTLACHSAVTDMRGRHDELLYSQSPRKEYNPCTWMMMKIMAKAFKFDSGSNLPVGVLKYLQNSPIPNYSTFVSLTYWQVKLADSLDYRCRTATFCEAPTTCARHVSKDFLNRHFDDDYRCSWGVIPNHRNYFVHLWFGENGLINGIIALDHSSKSEMVYSIINNDFVVKRCISGIYVNSISYILGQDGRFRRAPVWEDPLTIEDEISDILQPLPFAPFRVKSLQS